MAERLRLQTSIYRRSPVRTPARQCALGQGTLSSLPSLSGDDFKPLVPSVWRLIGHAMHVKEPTSLLAIELGMKYEVIRTDPFHVLAKFKENTFHSEWSLLNFSCLLFFKVRN